MPTATTVLPSVLAEGVNTPTQVSPPSLLLSVPSVPLLTFTSLLSKSATASEKVMVTVLVSPTFSATSLKAMLCTLGARVSNACCACALAVFKLPAASLATLAATDTDRVPLALASGVTTRVYTRADTAVNAPLVPLALTVTSSATKPDTSSLKVKVNVTGPPAVVSLTLSVMVTVGAVVSTLKLLSSPRPL